MDPSFEAVDKLYGPPGGTTPTAPTTASDTASGGNTTSVLWDLLNQVGKGYQTNVAQPATNTLMDLMNALPLSDVPGSQAAKGGIASLLVPQDITSAAIDLAALGTGGAGVGARLLAPTVAGALANRYLDQGSLLGGAARGGAAAATGELLGGLASVARRAGTFAPLGMPSQQTLDERAIGKAVGAVNPEAFGGIQTSKDFQRVLRGAAGPDVLSAQLEKGLTSIRSDLGQAAGAGGDTAAAQAIREKMGLRPGEPLPKYYGLGQSDDPLAQFNTLIDELRGKTKGAYNTQGEVRGTVAGDLALRARQTIKDDIHALLQKYAPQDVPVFDEAYRNYATGERVLDLFSKWKAQGGVGALGKTGLNVPALQEIFANKQKALERAVVTLTPEQRQSLFDALNPTIGRGAATPAVDKPATYVTTGLLQRLGPTTRETLRLPLIPPRYAGNPVSVPGLPFTLGVSNLLNPFSSGVLSQYVGQ